MNQTLLHAHFSSQIQRHDRVLSRVHACDPFTPSNLSHSWRFECGLAVGVAREILSEMLEKMLDICEMVLVDVQMLIRAFDTGDGTVRLVHLRDSGFHHLLPRIGFLKASLKEAPYNDVEKVNNECCVVLSNGEDGCTIYYKYAMQQISPFPTLQMDPTGSGDNFLGSLIFGLAEGLTVSGAVIFRDCT